jgi:hypothetical protein
MTTGSTRRVCLPSQRAAAGKESETQISARRHCTRCREMPHSSSSIYVRPKANRDAHIYERGFSFFSRYSARRATPDTLTTLKRTPGMSPTAWPLRPKPAIKTSPLRASKEERGRGRDARQHIFWNLAHRKPQPSLHRQGASACPDQPAPLLFTARLDSASRITASAQWCCARCTV